MAPDRMLDPDTLGDHVDRLFRAAWALSGSRADAEDLVQETFARVLAKPRRVRNEDDLGYLLQVLRNTSISSRRAAARRLAPVALDDSRAGRPELGDQARARRRGARGLRGDRRPREPFRDALVAVDVVGLSYAEAAELLGTKEATITSRLFRARAQVARGMKPAPEGVEEGRD